MFYNSPSYFKYVLNSPKTLFRGEGSSQVRVLLTRLTQDKYYGGKYFLYPEAAHITRPNTEIEIIRIHLTTNSVIQVFTLKSKAQDSLGHQLNYVTLFATWLLIGHKK